MVIKCPHCGQPTTRPQLFSITRQRIFNFIWDNPSCTQRQIEMGVYGRILPRRSNVIAVHLSHIRRDLTNTNYRLTAEYTGEITNTRNYMIQMLQPTVGQIRKALVDNTEVPPNAHL